MKKPFWPGSFSLVEILAATGILSVMMTIMFGILQQTSAGWQAANRRVEASQVARLALDQIAADLENAVVVIQTNVRTPSSQQRTNYAYGFVHANAPRADALPATGTRISQPNDYIFVVTPYTPSLLLGAGDLCEAGYIPFLNNSRTNVLSMRPGRYYLLRHCPLSPQNVSGAGTFTTTLGFQPTNDFLTNSSKWETTPDRISQTSCFPIVDNCLKFDVEFFYLDTAGKMTSSPTWGRPSTNTVGGWDGLPQGARPGLPTGAVITLCVVDDRTAERIWRLRGTNALRSTEIDGLPTNWNAVGTDLRGSLQASVLTLQRRIYFKNRPNP